MDHWPAAIDTLPPPFDAERAERLVERLGGLALSPRFARLVEFVAGCSPYLAQSMAREAALLPVLEREGARAVAEAEIAAAMTAGRDLDSAALMTALRTAKRRAALAMVLMVPHPMWMSIAGVLLPLSAALIGAWLARGRGAVA